MRVTRFLLPALGLAASLAFSGTAVAQQTPGSLLLFPSFDSNPGSSTVLTVTNTNADTLTGTVAVEFVYVEKDTCLEFNRTHILTPNDTLTVLCAVHNPVQQQGYVYVFAKSPITGQAITWDYLIGNMLDIDAIVLFDWSINPVAFQGKTLQGLPTDVDGDGLRDLNGIEYSKAPDELLVPRFFGQVFPISSQLILVNLTGGSRFTATVDFLVYNDNEEVFSTQYSFRCWDDPLLSEISGVFNQQFLLSTFQNPFEVQGVAGLETGWMRLNGHNASSRATTLDDPAIIAVLVEEFFAVATFGTADLPFFKGEQDNGDLLSNSLFGDTDDV
jgi:hypothetical protein